MNKNILNAFIVGSLAMGLASCSENSWNNHYLEGFEGGANYEKPVEGTYTITADNYSAISSLMQDKATTDAETAAAKAIKTNLYFEKNGIYSAQVALPAFFATSTFPYYYASVGSTVDVTYQEADVVPEEITALAGSKSYTISAADYAKVWGSETAFIRSFAPDATAAANLPSVLADAFAGETVEDGTFAVVTYNTAAQNPMFGLPDQVPAVADLYKSSSFKAGQYLIVDVEGNRLAGNISESKKYDYLPSADVTVNGESVSGFDAATQLWIFEATANEGEYYIKDMLGRYYYQSGTYNSFNVSESVAEGNDDYVWIVKAMDGYTWEIKNKSVNKWIQTPNGTYTTWGSYPDARGTYPQLFVVNAEASVPTEIPLYTPVSTTENAVYCYNGGKWAVATGVVALDPADYTAMGFSNNNLSDPEIYIPLYLRAKFPYAQSGAQEFVVYNRNKADLFVFDGSDWTLNNNGLETVVGRFERKSDGWKFVKYIGKAIFNEFKEAEIMRDRNYLFVVGDICANPIEKSKNYGYLYTSQISITDGQIVEKSDVNAYTFASAYEDEDAGTKVEAPAGQFLLRDSNGRYMYMNGTFNSANVSAKPTVADGQIASQYLWKATPNGDGTWAVSNVGNGKTMAYSANYSSFGFYDNPEANGVAPALYILSE